MMERRPKPTSLSVVASEELKAGCSVKGIWRGDPSPEMPFYRLPEKLNEILDSKGIYRDVWESLFG